MKQQFRSFEEARKFAHLLRLKGQKEWKIYCKSGKKPSDIPSSPHGTYKKQFKGYGDWLDTGRIANKDRKYKSFAEARKFILSLQLKGSQDWRKFCKSSKHPKDIPTHPHIVYKKEWKSWGDWFGTGRVATNEYQYRKFSDARELVGSLGLKNVTDWKEYCKSGKKPSDIPSAPWATYSTERILKRGERNEKEI